MFAANAQPVTFKNLGRRLVSMSTNARPTMANVTRRRNVQTPREVGHAQIVPRVGTVMEPMLVVARTSMSARSTMVVAIL